MFNANDLAEALRAHQQGDLVLAARKYQAILAHDPQHIDALHYLGVALLQMGDAPRAVESIARAAALAPTSAPVHANLAEAYRSCGILERAADSCRSALRLEPDHPQATNNLGLILLEQGETTAALELFRAALRLQPASAVVHNNLGNALRLNGDNAAALAAFREAVRLDANFADALGNLGQLLVEQNQAAQALVHCQDAVRLRPEVAELHNNLGNALRSLGRLAEAKTSYQAALRLKPALGITYNNMGQALQEEGELRAALRWYQQALQLAPNVARIHANFASAQEEQGDFCQAIARYQVALQLDPQFAEAHNGLGFVYHQQSRFAEAQAEYREVLRLRPTFASGHCNLGYLLEELGDLTEAETCYRTALRLEPQLAQAHAQLATLLRGKLPEDDLGALERVLARPHLPLGPRLALHFGLAHVRDGRKEFEAAAEHMQKGNDLCLELWKAQGQSYDPTVHSAFVDRLINVFTPAFFERVRGFGVASERPVFIVGLPRSGTTLTEQILASHPQVFGAGELDAIKQAFDSLPRLMPGRATPFECLAELDRSAAGLLAANHLAHLDRLNAPALHVVDKMPDNYLYLGLIATLFPRARIIHCRRDLRDIAISCWMTHFRSIRWASHPDHIAARFADYQRLMAHWQRVLPVDVLHVDYEQTVADVESMAHRLVAWCGLNWDASCLAFHQTSRPVRTASVTQVRQPIYRGSLERWRHYETLLGPLLSRMETLSS
jgi:tetratricopeptide (TPR) repeat protein